MRVVKQKKSKEKRVVEEVYYYDGSQTAKI